MVTSPGTPEAAYYAKRRAMSRDDCIEFDHAMAEATRGSGAYGEITVPGHLPGSALYREYACWDHPLWGWGLDHSGQGAAYWQLWYKHKWEYIDAPVLALWDWKADSSWRLPPFEYDPSSVTEAPARERATWHTCTRQFFDAARMRRLNRIVQERQSR